MNTIDFHRAQTISRAKHKVLNVNVITLATVLCACEQSVLTLKEAGHPVACSVCGRSYRVSGIRFDCLRSNIIGDRPMELPQVEVDIQVAEPKVLPLT